MAGVRVRAVGGLLLLTLLVPFLNGPVSGATVPYTLFGSVFGWGFTAGSITSPGPTLYADVGDTVDLTLNSVSGTHNWFLDYNGNSFDDGLSEPTSPTFSASTFFSFSPNQVGTFTYWCGFHFGLMQGSFQVNGTPEPTVTISAPAGGLRWTGGSSHDVVWTMTDFQSPVTALTAFLNYTSTAGSGTIAGPVPGATNPHTQPWTLPLVDAGDMRVNLTVIDPDGNRGYAEALVPDVDSTPPAVSSTVPADLATGVAVTTSLQVTFSEPMNQGATALAVSLQEFPSWNAVPLTNQGWAGNTLTLQPTAPLLGLTTYQANITAAATDASDPGNPLAPYTFQFQTVIVDPVTTLPLLTGGETWSGASSHDIVFTLSDEKTPVPALVYWVNYTSGAGSGAIAGPASAPASPETVPWNVPPMDAIDVTVSVTVRDTDGGTATAVSPPFEVDSIPPVVMVSDPANGTAGVGLTAPITLAFSEPMNRSATEAGVQVLALPSWTPHLMTVTGWTGANLTLAPTVPFASRTTYQVNVTGYADDSDPGNVGPAAWTRFTTVDLPPSVSITSPLTGTFSSPSSIPVVWTASDPDTAAGSLSITLEETTDGGGSWAAFATGLPGPGASTPWSPPAVDTLQAGLRASATDGNTTVSFTTPAFAIDATPPDVTLTSPGPGASGVPLNAIVQATFSEAMAPVPIDFGVQNLGDLTWVSGTEAWSAGDTVLTFTPSAALLALTGYRAFANASMTDTSTPGLPLAPFTWDFMTGTAADVTPPTLANLLVVPDPAAVSRPVNVSVDAQDETALATVSVVIRLGAAEVRNQSMTPGAGTQWFHVDAFAQPGDYDVVVTATDGSGNVAMLERTFTVGDVAAPSLSAVAASPDPAPWAVPVNVTATITDDVAVTSVRLAVRNATAEVANVSMAAAGGDAYFHMQAYLAGAHSFTITAEDAAGNAATATGGFTVQDPPPPTVSGYQTSPDPAEIPATVNVSAQAESVLGIAGVWFDGPFGNLTGTFDGASGRWFVTVPAPAPLAGNVTVSARDNGGRWATAAGAFLARDTTAPALSGFGSVAPPEANRTATYFVTTTDAYGILSVSLSAGPATVALLPSGANYSRDLALPRGTYAGTVAASDLANNTATLAVTIVVGDTEPPTIDHTDPGPSPVLTAVDLSFVVTDNDHVASVGLTWTDVRGVPGSLALGASPSLTAAIPPQLAAGLVTYTVTASDASGNVASLDGSVAITGTPPSPTLYASVAGGWGPDPGNLSTPGPTLTMREGEPILVTVIGWDGSPHVFFVDVDGDGARDAGEPQSTTVLGTFETVTVSAPVGTHTYYCDIHPGMQGTLVVVPANPAPWGSAWILPLLFLVIVIGVPVVLFLIRRRSRPEAPTPEDEAEVAEEEKSGTDGDAAREGDEGDA